MKTVTNRGRHVQRMLYCVAWGPEKQAARSGDFGVENAGRFADCQIKTAPEAFFSVAVEIRSGAFSTGFAESGSLKKFGDFFFRLFQRVR